MAKWIAYVLFLYFAFTLPIVIPYLVMRYKSWKLSRIKYGTRKLKSGEVIFKTEDAYFLAVDEKGIPLMVDKEEGARLWEQGEPI